MGFTPRYDIPEAGNPYYNRKASGGYNPCIAGNYPYNAAKTVGYPGLTVLPNCTGYATGRTAELIGDPKCEYFGKGDARGYYKVGKAQGLKVGNTPKLGACVVWDDGKYGHVAIVEQIIDEETIIVSQSGWYSRKPMWLAKHKRGNGNWTEGDDAYWMKKYTLVGFVYNPAVEEEDDMTKAETEKLVKEIIKETVPGIVRETIAEIKAETAKLPVDEWAKPAVNMAIAKDIMGGYSDGFHAQSNIRREEVAQVAANIEAYLKTILPALVQEIVANITRKE